MSISSLSRQLSENEVSTAYLQGGSFMKYLVEDVSKGDIKPFMKFFVVDGDYKRNFGKGLEELEAGWQDKIKNTKPLYALSDALKVEHLDARLQPSGPLDENRQRRAKMMSTAPSIAGGYTYPIWVDVKLESMS